MIPSWAMVVGVSTSVAGATWGGYEYLDYKYAQNTVVQVVSLQVDYVMEKQMAGLLAQINALEGKRVKTQDDRDHLKYLREELQRLRDIKRGK